MNLLKPPKLERGDIIGLVAPSFPFPNDSSSEYYQWYLKGKEEIEKMGFRIKEGKNLKKVKWWYAGTTEERVSDINSMFADREVKAIIAHDGGNPAFTILEYLDYELIKRNPKPFIGFSDITNIHSALYTKTGSVGFHMGLLSYSLGWVWNFLKPENLEKEKELFYKVLASTDSLGLIKPVTQWECWREGQAEGRLFGGNLSALANLVSTQYFPEIKDLKNTILFWEIDNTQSYRIQRALYRLKYAGLFEAIKGMIIGKCPDIKRTAWEGFEEPSLKYLVMDVVGKYDFPVLGEVDFGHKAVNFPMPIGLQARMNANKLKLEIVESAVI